MAGVVLANYIDPLTKPNTTLMGRPLEKQEQLYTEAAKQNVNDYGDIMGAYDRLISNLNATPRINLSQSYVPQTYSYTPTQDRISSLSNLSSLASTGGYSEGDISNLRARGISPIRAAYANAQRNVDRQRVLQGGYSPNYNAVTAKMAREMASLISDKVTDVNAGIAEQVAQNKINLGSRYAAETGQDNVLANQINARNADTINEARRYNIELPIRANDSNSNITGQILQALGSKANLYGTSPALTSTFGNQVLGSAQLQNNINNAQLQNEQAIINAILMGLRR